MTKTPAAIVGSHKSVTRRICHEPTLSTCDKKSPRFGMIFDFLIYIKKIFIIEPKYNEFSQYPKTMTTIYNIYLFKYSFFQPSIISLRVKKLALRISLFLKWISSQKTYTLMNEIQYRLHFKVLCNSFQIEKCNGIKQLSKSTIFVKDCDP